ncbi:MAG TPA: helix-turn-helix domain-containing protein [Hanamia sp.]
MNQEVTSGTLVPAKPPHTAAQETEVLKSANAVTDKAKAKPGTNQPAAVNGATAKPEEPSTGFSVWRTTRQIREEFHVSAKSLYNWRIAGILPHGLLGNKIMYNRTEIEKILKSRWNASLVLVHTFLDLCATC